jgi:type I restriction enzyme S subunit
MNQAWPTKRLADVCQILGGATPSKKNPKFYGGDIPWATVGDMNVEIITTTEEYITKAAVADCSTNVIPSGSIVMATRVGLGKVCVLGQDTAINQDLKGLTPKNTRELTTRWLFWWLKSKASDIQKAGTGATVQGVKMTFVQELEIPLPPLAEQKRIVALLDEAFAGIDEAKAKAEETRTAYSKMFDAQVELTFSDNQDWNKATLNDLGQTLTGTTPPTANPEYYGEYIPFIKPADFNEDGTLVTDNHGLSKEGEKVARVTNPDSVLMVCIGATIGKTGYTTKRITTNQQINSFTPGPLVNFRFAYYQMISSSFQKAVLSRANQATMPMISKSKWSEIPLQFPGNYSTQIKLAERLHDLKALTGQLAGMANRKVETLNEIKSSLLAQAFAGELTA